MNYGERVGSLFEEYQEKYDIDFKDEFYVKELIKLKIQYQSAPDEHIRAKTDLMNLILKLEQQLALKEKIHTIPLIDEANYNVCTKHRRIDSQGALICEINFTKMLKDRLKEGKEQNKLIDITGFRGIGKTRTLINFAKENGYIVIVPSVIMANEYSISGYDNIYHHMDYSRLRGIRNVNCVVDEGVDIDRIKNEFRLNIITGYVTRNIK